MALGASDPCAICHLLLSLYFHCCHHDTVGWSWPWRVVPAMGKYKGLCTGGWRWHLSDPEQCPLFPLCCLQSSITLTMKTSAVFLLLFLAIGFTQGECNILLRSHFISSPCSSSKPAAWEGKPGNGPAVLRPCCWAVSSSAPQRVLQCQRALKQCLQASLEKF